MPEHLFLCGLSDVQRKVFKGGRELNLMGPKPNVVLKIEVMRRRLAGLEPKRLTDLLDIASYVFAVDRTTGRGGSIFKNMGEVWRRPFHLIIGVRNPEFWSSSPVRDTLIEALQFISDDNWAFDFETLHDPTPLQDYLQPVDREADVAGETSIVLFSGGLDSFAGAVLELRTTNRRVVLVSHRNVPVMGRKQRELAEELIRAYPRRISHVFVDNHLKKGLPDRDQTQRTRSFFFTAIATVAAHLENSDRIRFYENGVMSINLPISGQVVGTKASRSTHPRSLQLLERIVGLVVNRPIMVDNPFIWNTKAEIVHDLQATAQRDLIGYTISCSRSRELDPIRPHCGVCAQCLQRRISTLGGDAGDVDHPEGYEIDFMLGPREPGIDRTMAVDTVRSAIEFTRLNDEGFMGNYAGELSRVQIAFPSGNVDEIAKSFFALFRRHGATVQNIVAGAVRDNADDIAAETISSESLLSLLLHSSGMAISAPEAPTKPARQEPDELGEVPVVATDLTEIIIAIDPERKWIIVDGLGALEGRAIFSIIELLVQMFREDRGHELRPDNYRGLLAKQLVDKLNATDAEAVRSAILRARKQIIDEFKKLYDIELDINAFIENRSRKGYRLNPLVRVVSLAEIKTK